MSRHDSFVQHPLLKCCFCNSPLIIFNPDPTTSSPYSLLILFRIHPSFCVTIAINPLSPTWSSLWHHLQSPRLAFTEHFSPHFFGCFWLLFTLPPFLPSYLICGTGLHRTCIRLFRAYFFVSQKVQSKGCVCAEEGWEKVERMGRGLVLVNPKRKEREVKRTLNDGKKRVRRKREE